eukprot:TRINITY_DN7935_c5_g1_i1.p1 TRINITY_DN7935_c5_g1~~TRINITY_DN7935_c5_g1_i1.p1  ORF type:complete len:537 (+),score=57.78 TRINITY_DN7935_c5_g1_i1:75-1685(+)
MTDVKSERSVVSPTPSNDSSAASRPLERGPGSFRLGSMRKKDTALIGNTCTDDEMKDRTRSLAWSLLGKKIQVSQIPLNEIVVFKKIVDSLLVRAEGSKETLCSSYMPSLWCCDELASFMEDDISSFTIRLKVKLSSEKSDPKLYVQPACTNETNTIRRFVEISQHSDKGVRPTMEDRTQLITSISNMFTDTPQVVWDDRLDHPELCSGDKNKWVETTEVFTAVFDGHMGKEAAVYARGHLHHHLVRSPAYPHNVEKALKEAFLKTSENFLTRANSTMNNSGTTATVAVILGNQLTVANVGDSMAVLYKREGCPATLSGNHHINNKEEVRRLTDLGAEVINIGGVTRINGQIRVTRTIGFRPSAKVLTAVPDVWRHSLQETDEFVVLATDGLWDVMSVDEVGRVVRDARKEIEAGIREATVLSACVSKKGVKSSGDGETGGTGKEQGEKYPPVPTSTPPALRHAFSHCYDTDSSFSDGFQGEAEDCAEDDERCAFMDYSVIGEALVSEALAAGTSDNIAVTIIFFNHPKPEGPQEP